MPRSSIDLRLFLILTCLVGMFSSSVQSQTLRLVTQDFPPFSYMEEGQVAGPAAELIRLVCKEMSVQCELDLLPWRRAMKSLKMGAYQGAFLIGWNQQRSEWLHYSPALISTEYGFFVSTSNTLEYDQPADITGYTVAVYGPSNTSHSLRKLSDNVKGMQIVMQPDDEPGFRQLEVFRVDSVYSNRDVGRAMIGRLGIKGVRYAGAHRKLSYYVGFPKQYVDSALVDSFKLAYFGLLKSGKIDMLLKPYGMQPEHEFVIK